MVTRIYKNVIPAYNGLYRICNIMDVLSTRDRARTIIETQIQLKLAADARKMTSVPPIADAKDARFPAKKPKEDEYQPLTIAHYEQKRDSHEAHKIAFRKQAEEKATQEKTRQEEDNQEEDKEESKEKGS